MNTLQNQKMGMLWYVMVLIGAMTFVCCDKGEEPTILDQYGNEADPATLSAGTSTV